jgi:hypothetical protein
MNFIQAPHLFLFYNIYVDTLETTRKNEELAVSTLANTLQDTSAAPLGASIKIINPLVIKISSFVRYNKYFFFNCHEHHKYNIE